MDETPQKKVARWCAAGCTMLNLALFYPSFYVGLLGSNIANNSTITGTTGTIMVFASIAVPFFFIFSIFLLWAMYFQNLYRAMYMACLLPFIVAVVMLIFMRLLVS